MILSIGLDIMEIEHIDKIMQRNKKGFLKRVFHSSEISYCEQSRNKNQHYTARFAVKEAAFKALGTGWAHGINWKQIEIVNNDSGAPQLKLSGKAKEISILMGAKKIHVSISCCDEYAMAVVVFEGDSSPVYPTK